MKLPFYPVDAILTATVMDRAGQLNPRTGNWPDHPSGRIPASDAVVRIGPIQCSRNTPARLVDERTLKHWRVVGVDPWMADRIATALGWAPWLLWPDWCDVIDDEVERWEAAQERRRSRRSGQPVAA